MLFFAKLQAAKQVVDQLLPRPLSWADMFAISGAVQFLVLPGPQVTHVPLAAT